MSSPATSARRRLATIGAVIVLGAVAASCGSDDPAPELPEGGTGSAFNDAIITSESHDEVLLEGGTGEMLVAVDCDPQTGGNVVTVVAEGLAPAVYTGEFDELVKEYSLQDIYFKEHPLNRHYRGTEESRDWMFDVEGYFPSFFAFWKKCQKSRKKLIRNG